MSSETYTVLAVGDVFLDRPSPGDAFSNVQDRFDAADIVIGNHEAPLSDSGEKRFFYPWLSMLKSPPEMVEGLNEAGFDIMSLANNQSMNYGPEGLMDSIELLQSRGIDVCGAGENETAAIAPAVRTIGETSVGVIGIEATRWDWADTKALPDQPGLNQIQISPWYSPPHVSRLGLQNLRETVTAATDVHDIVFVLAHFGLTGSNEVAVYQRAIAHEAAEAGADAVIGAHSHTLQAVEVHDGTPIFYSLGNFAFEKVDHWGVNWFPSETAVAEFSIHEDGLDGVSVHPALFDDGEHDKPRILDPSEPEYEDVRKLLVDLSSREGTDLEATKEGLQVPL